MADLPTMEEKYGPVFIHRRDNALVGGQEPSDDLKSFGKSKMEIIHHLGLVDDERYLAWFRSSLFAPFFTELWNDFLRAEDQMVETGETKPKKLPLFRIIWERFGNDPCFPHGPAGLEFSPDLVDKEGWGKLEHLAYFLYRITRANREDLLEGVLCFSTLTPKEDWFVMYQALIHARIVIKKDVFKKAARA